MQDIRHETYLLAISEHGDRLEDSLGRLSMWRAYGRQNGIAIVFNNAPFINNSDAQHSFSVPVSYDTPETFAEHFKEIVDAIENNIAQLTRLGGPWFQEMLVCVFRFAIQSTKHPAFAEEREWRVIYSPTLLLRDGEMTDEQLSRVPTEVMSLGGVPQRIYAINWKDYPGKGASRVTASALLDRVLIGPTEDAYAIAQAFIAELDHLGIEDATSKVVMTGIPLRQSAA